MFWADLARPTNSTLSFLLALFQLVLHIPSLSRLAIDTRPNADRAWIVFRRLHRYASRMLQIAIPLAKVSLLMVLLCAVPKAAKAVDLRWLAAIVAAVIVFSVALLLMNLRSGPILKSPVSW
jgi:hypothetical protein